MQIFVCGCLEEGMLSMTDKRINVVLDEFFIPSFDCRFFKIFGRMTFLFVVVRLYFSVIMCIEFISLLKRVEQVNFHVLLR